MCAGDLGIHRKIFILSSYKKDCTLHNQHKATPQLSHELWIRTAETGTNGEHFSFDMKMCTVMFQGQKHCTSPPDIQAWPNEDISYLFFSSLKNGMEW